MSDKLDDTTLCRHSLSVLIEFLQYKSSEFKSGYFIKLKEKEINHLRLNKPSEEARIKDLSDIIEYTKGLYGEPKW